MSNYEGRLKKEDWEVRPVSIETARRLVYYLHYSKSGSNTGVYFHGLFQKGMWFEQHCMGVAWWLPPTKTAAAATYPEGDWRKVLSLHRFVIHPEVPENGASFLLGKSMKMINTDKWECLLTYADTWQGHEGTIYKATNWEYVELTKPSSVYVSKQGKMMGRKRGAKNFSAIEMKSMGFDDKGKHCKHKFRKIIK